MRTVCLALLAAGGLIVFSGEAHAAVSFSGSGATKTGTLTENTASIGSIPALSIAANGAGLADDRLVAVGFGTVVSGCTALGAGVSCPLAIAGVPFETVAVVLSGVLSTYTVTLDLDRPGLRMRGVVTFGSQAGGSFNGAATTVGELVVSGAGTAVGGADDDVLTGGDGANTLTGGAGDDVLTGGKGNDTMIGGPGDDTVAPGSGANEVADGGEGSQDTLSAAGETTAVAYSLDGVANDGMAGQALAIAGFENLAGGESADTLTGDVGFNHIYGAGAGDVIDGGGGGHDVLRGQDGDDMLRARDASPLFGDIACGGGTDTAVVDVADLVASDCEAVDVAPAPPGYVAPPFPGGPTPATPAPAPATGATSTSVAVLAPKLTLTLPTRVRRADLRRGVRVGVASDQTVVVTAELVTTAKGVRARATVPSDNVVLARTTARGVRARTFVRLKAPASLTRGVRKVAVRVTAVNAAGVRTAVRRSLRLR